MNKKGLIWNITDRLQQLIEIKAFEQFVTYPPIPMIIFIFVRSVFVTNSEKVIKQIVYY